MGKERIDFVENLENGRKAQLIVWHDVKQELPSKSGDYLVMKIFNGGKKAHYYYLPYSVEHKDFNCTDGFPALNAWGLDKVDYWAEMGDVQ